MREQLGAWLRAVLGVASLSECEAVQMFCVQEIREELRKKELYSHWMGRS
jgi:hypothetical protein